MANSEKWERRGNAWQIRLNARRRLQASRHRNLWYWFYQSVNGNGHVDLTASGKADSRKQCLEVGHRLAAIL